jgi:hypothetical protein
MTPIRHAAFSPRRMLLTVSSSGIHDHANEGGARRRAVITSVPLPEMLAELREDPAAALRAVIRVRVKAVGTPCRD